VGSLILLVFWSLNTKDTENYVQTHPGNTITVILHGLTVGHVPYIMNMHNRYAYQTFCVVVGMLKTIISLASRGDAKSKLEVGIGVDSSRFLVAPRRLSHSHKHKNIEYVQNIIK
jgi:hypothetical protein